MMFKTIAMNNEQSPKLDNQERDQWIQPKISVISITQDTLGLVSGAGDDGGGYLVS